MAYSKGESGIYVQIPRHRTIEPPFGNSYTVYCVEVFNDTQKHSIEKRYREFYKLRKKLKKVIKPHPKFPPKKVGKNVKHVVEVRQVKLERYLNTIVQISNNDVLAELFRFLDVIPTSSSATMQKHLESDAINDRWDNLPPIARLNLEPTSQDIISNIVTEGIISCIYDN